ncbi:hypothetical protein ACFQV4_34085 [Streptomyces thermocarboxydus]
MDYPLIQNFLQPLYYTNASSNDGKWSNKQFDDLVNRANQETDTAKAVDLFQQAEGSSGTTWRRSRSGTRTAAPAGPTGSPTSSSTPSASPSTTRSRSADPPWGATSSGGCSR